MVSLVNVTCERVVTIGMLRRTVKRCETPNANPKGKWRTSASLIVENLPTLRRYAASPVSDRIASSAPENVGKMLLLAVSTVRSVPSGSAVPSAMPGVPNEKRRL